MIKFAKYELILRECFNSNTLLADRGEADGRTAA